MQGTYDPSFTIDLQSKDNQLGYDMAKKYKVIFYIYIGKLQTYNFPIHDLINNIRVF